MRRYVDFLERVVAYKDRKIIIWGAGINGRQIQKALSIRKINVTYFVDGRQKDGVFSPDKLLSEDKEKSLVIVSPHHIPYIKAIDENLLEWGWEKDNNYINFVTDDIINANQDITYFDPFLGFSQIKDIEGFYVCGDMNYKDKIVLLGNCTSLPGKLEKSWVDWVAEKQIRRGITLLNGACAGYSSSQEVLKMIRDVLVLSPKVIIVFNGVIDATDVNREEDLPYYTKFECNLLESRFSFNDKVIQYKEMQDVPSKVLYGLPNCEENWEHYIRNMRIMHAIADELNIKFFCFLQPSLYSNSSGMLSEEKEIFKAFYQGAESDMTYSNAHNFYDKVRKELGNENWFYDMTGIFEGVTDSAYLDEIHYTDIGNEVIGKAIMRIVENGL